MLIDKNIKNLNWEKTNNIIPMIAQHYISGVVLMHGYMTKEALYVSQKKKMLTLYSREKKRLWTKGEQSNNFLYIVSMYTDCDQDTLLVLVKPVGYACHLNKTSCFNTTIIQNYSFLFELEKIIDSRRMISSKNSYISQLLKQGVSRITQKVGEESVEIIIAALEKNTINIIAEASDLIFHLLILLRTFNLSFNDIILHLIKRHK